MAWPDFILQFGGKLKEDFERFNTYFATIKGLWNGHVGGTADKHSGEAINLNDEGKTKITATDVQTAIDQIEEEIKNFIDVSANAEVGDAHISTAKGKTFDNIRDRFEDGEAEFLAYKLESAQHTKGKINIYEYENLVVDNDWTNAINSAIVESISSKKTVYIPEGEYIVSNSLLPYSATPIVGLTIVGDGNERSVIKFQPSLSSVVCFDFTNVYHGKLQDFKILGEEQKGVGIKMGEVSTSKYSYNNDFINVYCRGLDIGINMSYAWSNSFTNVKTRYCNKGMIVYGGANSFSGYNAEACLEFGIKIITGLSQTSISFNGIILQSNPIGMIVDGGNVVINNGYFEGNTIANIQGGLDIETVSSITINGLHSGDYQKYLFDKVNVLSIKGATGFDTYNQYQVSPNVKSFEMSESSQMLSSANATYIQTVNASMKKAKPIIVNDLQEITTFVNPLPLDFTGAIQARQASTTGSLQTVNSKKVIKYVATIGGFNGMYLFMDFNNRYLKNYRKLKLKTRLFIDTSTFASISNSRLNTKVRINYLNTSPGSGYQDYYDINPADADNTKYNIRGNHITHTVKLDIDSMVSTIVDFESIVSIYVYYYPIVNAVGGETFYFEGFELYPNTEVKDSLLDSVNVAPFNVPILISPNGTKYTINVDNDGVLTSSIITQ